MEDQALAKNILLQALTIYKMFPHHNESWQIFWKHRQKHNPTASKNISEFIDQQTTLISECFNLLGKDHPVVKKFAVSLPLRLSKNILSWPTTPEMLRDLMTD